MVDEVVRNRDEDRLSERSADLLKTIGAQKPITVPHLCYDVDINGPIKPVWTSLAGLSTSQRLMGVRFQQ